MGRAALIIMALPFLSGCAAVGAVNRIGARTCCPVRSTQAFQDEKRLYVEVRCRIHKTNYPDEIGEGPGTVIVGIKNIERLAEHGSEFVVFRPSPISTRIIARSKPTPAPELSSYGCSAWTGYDYRTTGGKVLRAALFPFAFIADVALTPFYVGKGIYCFLSGGWENPNCGEG